MIDVVRQIEGSTRRVSGVGETRTVTISQTYDAALDDVWDACTNPERIPRWFLPVTGDLRIGGTYQLEGNAGGTIEECDPPNRFRATWEFGGSVSWIGVRLVADTDERTRFELAHTLPVDDHWSEYGPGAVGVGWDSGLVGLGLHLASGAVVDPARFDVWSRSPDGTRFMTMSSEAWRDADIAAGTPPTEANATASRDHRRLHAGPRSLIGRG